MEYEFIHPKQGVVPVLEYVVKFIELPQFALNLVSANRQILNRFEEGLNLDLQEKLATHMTKSYQELYE